MSTDLAPMCAKHDALIHRTSVVTDVAGEHVSKVSIAPSAPSVHHIVRVYVLRPADFDAIGLFFFLDRATTIRQPVSSVIAQL